MASGQGSRGPRSCPGSCYRHMGEVRLLLHALECKGAARAPALPPLCWPEGPYLSTLSFHHWGGSGIRAFPCLVTPNLACQTLLAPPSASGSVWERCQVPRSAPHFSAFLGHRGPLDATQTFRAQGTGYAAGLEWLKERRCPLSHLSSLQHLPCALTHPWSQSAKHPQRLAPPSPLHQPSLQTQLSRSPKKWGGVWGAWPQIHPGGSEPV